MDVKAEARGFSVEECSRLRAQQVQEPGGGQTWWLSGRNCLVIPAPEGGVASEDREEPNHHRLWEISLDFILKGMEGLLGVVQWLRPCTSTTGGVGLIGGRGTKIPYVDWPKEKKKRSEKLFEVPNQRAVISDTISKRLLWLQQGKKLHVTSYKVTSNLEKKAQPLLGLSFHRVCLDCL